MIYGLVKTLRSLKSYAAWLQSPNSYKLGESLEVAFFLYLKFALALIDTLAFLVEVPIHLSQHPTTSFVLLATRRPSGEFVDSYFRYYQRYQIAVASVLLFIIVTVLQIYIIGVSYYSVGRPEPAQAYTTSITLNPVWDRTGVQVENIGDDGSCPILSTVFSCESASAVSLKVGLDNQASNCDAAIPGAKNYFRSAMKFSLAAIPNNATITDVDLVVNVTGATTELVDIFLVAIGGSNTDNPDPDSNSDVTCATAGTSLYEKLALSTNYISVNNWNTTGSKTHDLGTTADSNVQTRITGSDLISVGVRMAPSGVPPVYDSVDSSNDPQLVITYTLPPQAPTSTNHSANTTSTITWTWTDNATEDTSNVIHNASHSVMCSAGAVSSNGSTGSCQETSLSVNTQYTRHPNVVDPHGNTDGPSLSAYTSIETPAGVTFNSVSANSITISATGGVSNLNSGSSGLHFRNTVTLDELLWTQTNTWTNSGLGANTQYGYDIRARNGDGDVTGFSAAVNKYTLSAVPDVASSRTISTWYNTATFPFTNNELWGGGGIQYYRYVWNQITTHTFSGSESTWSSINANCPGGTCTDAGTTLSKAATADGNTWYLHAQSFNAENVANGSGTNYGPYFFDSTNPTAPATVNDGTGSDTTYQTSTTTISANWTAATDATSGLQKYQYAIGTTSGGTQTLGYTDNGTATSVTNSSLTLSNGTTYYVSVRAVDNASNAGGVTTSNGVTVDTSGPIAPTTVNDGTGADIDSQTSTSEISANWTAVTDSGSGLQKYQYAIGTSSGGGEIVSYTDNSTSTSVTRSGLSLSVGTTYYVSVRAVDTLNNTGSAATSDGVTVNAATTTMTLITNVQTTVLSSTSVRITWTTNEPATSKVRYGLTTAYGSEVSDATLVSSHSITLSGLQPNTIYHYEVLSTGTTSDSDADATFTMLPAVELLPTPTPVLPKIDQLVLTSRPLFTGNALSGNTIFLFVDGMLDSVFKATEHDSGIGSYAYQLRHDLGFGQHTFYVQARDDASGKTSRRSAARTFITFPDVPATIFDPIRDAVVIDDHVTVTGIAWTTYDVFIFIDKDLAGVVKASVGRGGVGDFAFVTGELEPGEHTLHVRIRDPNGKVGLASTLRTFTIAGP